MQLMRSLRTSDTIPRDAYILKIDIENEYLCLLSTTYDPNDKFYLYPKRLLWILDFNGQTLQKVKLEDNNGKSMFRFAFVYDKLKNDLILAYAYEQGLFDPPKSKLQFYTSTGISEELQLKSEIDAEDSLKVIWIQRMTKTEEGNLILLWEEFDVFAKNERYDDIDGYSMATSFICFNPAKLGLTSSSDEMSSIHTEVKIFPNPATSIINIDVGTVGESWIDIFDIHGNKVIHKHSLLLGENQLDISLFAAGIYTYQVYAGENRIKCGKWIKM